MEIVYNSSNFRERQIEQPVGVKTIDCFYHKLIKIAEDISKRLYNRGFTRANVENFIIL